MSKICLAGNIVGNKEKAKRLLQSFGLGDQNSKAKLVIQAEANFNRHLPMRHQAIDNMAAGFNDLKPFKVVQCFRRFSNAVVYGVVTALCRTTNNFNILVGIRCHIVLH